MVIEHRKTFTALTAFYRGFYGRIAGSPRLAVNKNIGIDTTQFPYDLPHGFQIHQTHQIKAESVHFVFLGPVFNRLYNKTAHHGVFAAQLVTAAGTVPVRTVGMLAVKKAGDQAVKIILNKRIAFGSVIVHHIQNHAYAPFM